MKENIAVFGGDAERITVAGQSGGAAGCGALHASPLMKGLIQRLSIESGAIYYGFMQPQDQSVYEAKGAEFMEPSAAGALRNCAGGTPGGFSTNTATGASA